VIATRLLPFPTFTITSGAPLGFDRELAALFIEQLARNLIGLALGDPDETKAAWREKVARSASNGG
jgi:hypothetical protein